MCGGKGEGGVCGFDCVVVGVIVCVGVCDCVGE